MALELILCFVVIISRMPQPLLKFEDLVIVWVFRLLWSVGEALLTKHLVIVCGRSGGGSLFVVLIPRISFLACFCCFFLDHGFLYHGSCMPTGM